MLRRRQRCRVLLSTSGSFARLQGRSCDAQEERGGFGPDYTFEATGSSAVMQRGVEATPMGWEPCTIAGVAGRGEMLEVIPRWLIQGRAGGSPAPPSAA
jgi:Zn-dependent alcohol dehydrogenase